MLSERMKPRLRAEEEKGTVEEETRKDDGLGVLGEKEREECMKRASVLSSLSFSLCCVIYVFTSVMQACICRVWSASLGLHDW